MRKLSQESWLNLSKATQLVSGWVKIQTKAVWLLSPLSWSTCHTVWVSPVSKIMRWILTQPYPSWWSLHSLQWWMFFLGAALQLVCCLLRSQTWKPPFMIHAMSSFSYVTYQGAKIFENHRWTCFITCFLVNDPMSPVKFILICHLLEIRDKLCRLWSINSPLPLNAFFSFLLSYNYVT